jgi:hypothetical protein
MKERELLVGHFEILAIQDSDECEGNCYSEVVKREIPTQSGPLDHGGIGTVDLA